MRKCRVLGQQCRRNKPSLLTGKTDLAPVALQNIPHVPQAVAVGFPVRFGAALYPAVHQLYRGEAPDSVFFGRISEALTLIAQGGIAHA